MDPKDVLGGYFIRNLAVETVAGEPWSQMFTARLEEGLRSQGPGWDLLGLGGKMGEDLAAVV